MNRTTVGLLSASLTLSCTAPSPRPPPARTPLERPFASPAALLAAVRQRNDAYRTLRQVHRVSLDISLPGGRRERHSCTGVLVVARPDRFRLGAIGPLGVKLFDIRWVNRRTEVLALSPAVRRSGALPRLLGSIAADILAIYRLGPPPTADRRDWGTPPSVGRPTVELLEYRAGKLRRRLEVLAGSAAVTRTEIRDGADLRTVTYADHQRVGELLLPRRIEVSTGGEVPYRLTIRVTRSEVDPPLPAEVFPPSSATRSGRGRPRAPVGP